MSVMKQILVEVSEMYYGDQFYTAGMIAKELNIPLDLVYDALIAVREMEMETE